MQGSLHRFFTEDHRKLNDILKITDIQENEFDIAAYDRFRKGLLKHIKMEETILFPALEKYKRGVFTERIEKLRLEHGALTALLVPPPSSVILKALRFILSSHNILEEEPEGLYDLCDEFVQNPETVLNKLEQTSEVPVLAHKTELFILEATRRALKRAGYDYDYFETH